jgi:hypothetical protein
MNLMQSPLIAPAWDAAFVHRARSVFPSENKYRADLVSKWTRDGRVPTLEEAEAMEGREYAATETLDGAYPTTGD